MTAPSPEAVVVMDRFVSASSAQDAVESLQEIVNGLKRRSSNDPTATQPWHADWVLDHEDMAEHLVWVLQHSTLKGRDIPCGEEGVHLVVQLYQHLVQQSRKALDKPTPGILLESLLDVLDHPYHPNPIYVRVLAMKVLEELSKRHKSVASNQWLQAPNGLHRLADILATDVEANPLEEAVRDQALSVAKLLAKEAALAKVFLFAEVESRLLDVCWSNGGLTEGKPIVIDALQLIVELLKHADASLQDLVWQRPNVAPRLIKLVDLRSGQEHLHPKEKSDKKRATSKSNSANDDDDDLDNLLASGGDSSTSKPKEEKQDGADKDSEQDVLASLPHLLPSEVEVVQLALKIVGLLLESESLQHSIWKQQKPLCGLVWEMALINPRVPAVCSLPPPSLQQEALALVAEKMNDPEIMAGINGLDRLLYLVCTGGGIAKSLDEKMTTSQSALAVLRHTLSGDIIHETLMRTLAPPPIPDDDENAEPPGPTVVHRLWSTVGENLSAEKTDQRAILLSGAFGGLGLMLCDEQSKEIMSRLSPISVDQFLECLFSEEDELIQCSMLRFLCAWTYQCPLIAHNLLSSPSSTHLAGMAATPSGYQSLVHLLLGLAMEYLTKEEDCGGWTRAGILQIITKIGISKYTNSLESLKTKANPKMPWVVSDLEFKSWKEFCSQAVLIVRKRVVEELAGGSGEDEDSDDEAAGAPGSGDKSASGQGTKPLRRLISQQAKENEELRQQLEEAQAKVSSQENQINTWKRRLESTPTELDSMLNEFQAKTAKLEEAIRLRDSEVQKLKSEKDAAANDSQEMLLESQREIELVRAQEKEARDDLERTEQDMRGLNQLYSNLEAEYQRLQSSQGVGAPTGEGSQQQGEASHQTASSGSLEVATLRAENDRLRNDTKAADDWMSMAVGKMNEMGAANGELQQQIAALSGQLHEAQTSTQKDVQSQEALQREKHGLETELQQTKESLATVQSELESHKSKSSQLEQVVAQSESELADLQGLRKLLDSEKQRTAQLEGQVEASSAELADLRGLRRVLDSEKQRTAQLESMISESQNDNTQVETLMRDLRSEQEKSLELEKRLADAEEQLRSTTAQLEQERSQTTQLRGQLESGPVEVPKENSEDRDDSEALRAKYDSMLASKDQEILSLTNTLKQVRDEAHNLDDNSLLEKQELARKEVESIQTKSQQDIYRLESTIRELKDRLGSGKGPYSYEDIQSRDKEIEELRKANDAAQEWMGNAVEHHQKNAAEIAKLTEEKTALMHQLDEERMKSSMPGESASQSLQQELLDKTNELESLKQANGSLNSELEGLKNEKEEQQSLLDDLGIAMDDVGIMQEKLVQSEKEKKVLEEQLAGNALHQEVEGLRAANADLESRYGELQSWAEMAQSKMSEMAAAQDSLQLETDAAKRENEALVASAHSPGHEDSEELNNVREVLQELEIAKKTLEEEMARMRSRNEALSSQLEESEPATKSLQPTEAETPDRSAIKELETALAAANETITKDEEIVQQWEERTASLEANIASLQTQLQEQEDDAENAITQWQEACTAAEEKCTELEIEIQTLKDNQKTGGEGSADELPESLARKQAELQEAQMSIESSRLSIQEMKDQISDLQVTLEQKDAETNASVSQLREQLEVSEGKCNKLQDELDSAVSSKEEERLQGEDLARQQNEALISDLRDELKALKEEKEEMNARESEATAESEAENETLRQSTAEKESLREQLAAQEAEADSIIRAWEERLATSETENEELRQRAGEVDSLKEQLASQTADANNVIEAWEERLNASEAENQEMRQRLEEASAQQGELHALRETVSQDEDIVHQWEARSNELSETVAALKQQVESLQAELQDQEEEAAEAISKWQENCTDLETRCADIETELTHTSETIASRDWTIEQLKAKNESYHLQVDKLKIDSQVNPAIEDELVEATSEISRLTEVLETERQKRVDEREKFQAELADERGRHAEARDEIETLTTSLEEFKTESEDVVNAWNQRCEELSQALEDAKNQLEAQEIEANEAISLWAQKAEELDSQLDEAESRLSASEEGLVGREEELKAELKSLQQSHDSKLKELTQELKSKSKGSLEAERDRLTVVITQLEEELREANEMVQACITDESSDKATEAAAQALREEIQELRLQMGEYKHKYEEERSAREVAALEAERLRDDIAALVALSEEDSAPANVEKLTTKAIEKLQKRERAEIEEMRLSLFRALQDLEITRTAERESNEKLSKVMLQLTMYEQEIIAAKSEISFLSQAMEELRETEESKRASLEYRVGSLEHENDVVRKYHTAELETVRNELSQITMDRDRIIHQLKEVEKTNASLVYASSKEDSLRSELPDNEAECTKLRIENAHLLTMAADDKARAERRLREMLAAQSASNEADVILQTELRVSAEEAVETLKVELEALRSERSALLKDADPTLRKLDAEHTKELESTRSSLERLQRENQNLKEKMEQSTLESKQKIESLTDECRRAQATLHKMKQEGRFEAMVHAEKSRLSSVMQSPARRDLSNGNGAMIVAENDPAGHANGNHEPSLSSAEAFDMIQKLKQEVFEERKSHREFLQEHDHVLTMLALLDREKTALMDALGRTAAEEVIHKAHQVSAE